MESKKSYPLFRGPRTLPVIHQTEAAECGLACLAMVLGYHGYQIDIVTMHQKHPLAMRGMTLGQLMALAESYALSPRPLRVKLERLSSLGCPAILHWDMNHFVVLKKATDKKVVIHDPASGQRILTWDEVSQHFTGIALELVPQLTFKTEDARKKMSLWSFFKGIEGLKGGVATLLSLSLCLLVFSALAPLCSQLILDKVLKQNDHSWLMMVTAALFLAALVNTAVEWVRSNLLVYLTNLLNFHLSTNVLRHLMELPLSWFEKRHMGDVLSRFSSTEQIRSILTGTLVSSILDGFMALLMVAVMLFYSGQMTVIAILFVVVYATMRLLLFGPMRRMSEESLESSAKSESNFMETVRGIQSIKIFGRESDRWLLWQKRLMDVIGIQTKLGRFSANAQALESFLSTCESALMTYLGVLLVFEQKFTPGMFIAFFTYQSQFSSKALAFVGSMLDYKMVYLHVARLADIVQSTPERHLMPSSITQDTQNFQGKLELRNVSFRYSEGDPWLFKSLNLAVQAGESLAIGGPSGCGKSTLVKIMLGLLEPQEGVILADGIDIRHMGLALYRRHLGAVMQDDQLFSGSIADNITFFAPQLDHERLHSCAQIAAIDRDIVAMPMGYNSLVGDMGSALSGGQKQRILLARALYRQPKMLFLDEATCHLDVPTEQTINESIKELPITRIIIAHRPETIHSAQQILWLGANDFPTNI